MERFLLGRHVYNGKLATSKYDQGKPLKIKADISLTDLYKKVLAPAEVFEFDSEVRKLPNAVCMILKEDADYFYIKYTQSKNSFLESLILLLDNNILENISVDSFRELLINDFSQKSLHKVGIKNHVEKKKIIHNLEQNVYASNVAGDVQDVFDVNIVVVKNNESFSIGNYSSDRAALLLYHQNNRFFPLMCNNNGNLHDWKDIYMLRILSLNKNQSILDSISEYVHLLSDPDNSDVGSDTEPDDQQSPVPVG